MVLLAVAKENNLDIEFVTTNPADGLSAEYVKLNPLKKVPTFEAPNGWILSEVIAIAIYCKSQFYRCSPLHDESYYHIQLSLA